MRAARFHGTDDGLVVEDDVPEPSIGPGGVLVRVGATGLCHSDLHILDGDLPLPGTPVTLGHEIAGTVEAVGEGVDSVAAGDAVAVYGPWGCRECRTCAAGRDQLCDLLNWVGVGHDGGYADLVAVPSARYCVPLDGLDPVEAAPLTDAGLTAYHAVRLAADGVAPTDAVLVVGAGGLGQCAIQLARAVTGARVVAADVDAAARERAAALGADAVIDPDEERLPRAVKDATGGDGAAAALDFVGTDETLRAATDALAPRGTLALAGLGGGQVPFSWNPLRAGETTHRTVYWGTVAELYDVIELARQGRLELPVETVGFDGLLDGFERLRSGDVGGRLVLTP